MIQEKYLQLIKRKLLWTQKQPEPQGDFAISFERIAYFNSVCYQSPS